MFELLGQGIATLMHLKYLVPLVIGTLIGVIGGALPGITITMTIIVVLPFTFGLEPLQGLAAMIGVYVGGETGGLITSCLLGIPGKPSSVATMFDGFPMSRRGEPGRAVWLGVYASLLGGLLGAVVLVASTGPLARLALEFGPWEYFSLFILALSMVAGLVESSMVKGLIAGGLGLVVTVLGNDPVMGKERLTLGIPTLEGGIPFLPVLIGTFAFAQIMSDIEKLDRDQGFEASAAMRTDLSVSHMKVLWEIIARPFVLLWSSLIGLVVGVLPAIGGSAANMLAYDQAKKFSRHPERFGKGAPEGIIAAEASNNANVAGSLVTIMAFGIPGDAVTAVMLGALTIHGIQSGPLFVTQNGPLAYGMFAAYILAHPVVLIILAVLMRWMIRIVTVPQSVLFPSVLVLCVIGAYALGNTISSVWILLAFGVFGYGLVKLGFPLAPFILGVILGDQIEINLIRALMTDPDPLQFIQRPISGGLLLASLLSVLGAVWQHLRQKSHRQSQSNEADTDF